MKVHYFHTIPPSNCDNDLFIFFDIVNVFKSIKEMILVVINLIGKVVLAMEDDLEQFIVE